MKCLRKIGLYILISQIALASFNLNLYAKDSEISSLKPIVFSTVQGKQWAEECIEYYPELLWLADENVQKTEEGQATSERPYSQQIFHRTYVEFDRTIMTLHSLKLILNGSDIAYQTFTEAQPKDTRLTRESFKWLHLQGKQLLESKWNGLSEQCIAQTMETALILGDMGKSERARATFKSNAIQAPDHDDFYGEALKVLKKYPHLSPSFARLPEPAKELLLKIANLAHYGHITHLEGGMAMFSKLKQSALPSHDPFALSFDLFIHSCDVAGALGHVNKESSLAYTELTHKTLQAAGDAIKILCNPNNTEREAYNAYLTTRASWLGLNAKNPSERVLTRLGTMLRLFTPEEGSILKKAMLQLDDESRTIAIDQLNAQKEDRPGRTPTYMPAVLINLANNPLLGASKEERLLKAIRLGLPFISKVLKNHQALLAAKQADPEIPLNFNKIAGIAKTSPELLSSNTFYVDREGNVILNLK